MRRYSLVQEQLIQTAGRINFIYRMLLGKCQVKKVWKQSYKDKLVIACFTQIVLETTTRSMGDPQQIPHWRFHLAISVQHCLCWTETNPPQHAGSCYNIVKWFFRFFLLLVLHSVRPKKEQVRENSGFAFTFKRTQWPKLDRGHDSSTRLNTSEKVKWGTMQ